MKNKWIVSVISGLVATSIMTMVGLMAPVMGLPKMNPAEMLSMMMGFPVMIGWVMHFMIGTVFSLGYTILEHRYFEKISNFLIKGSLFGFAVFALAQMMMAINAIMIAPASMQGTLIANLASSVIGHIVYGVTIASINKIFIK